MSPFRDKTYPHPYPPPLVEGVKTLLSANVVFNSSSQRGEVGRGESDGGDPLALALSPRQTVEAPAAFAPALGVRVGVAFKAF
ncbi:MAG: hypothetical protein RLZZ612_1821 [Pseudomonadota bacterium]